MVIYTKDTGQLISRTARANSSSAISRNMKAIFSMVVSMVLECTVGPLETSTQGIFGRIDEKD